MPLEAFQHQQPYVIHEYLGVSQQVSHSTSMALNELPNELVLQVFQQIDGADTLQAAACTCKKFKDIAEICLYRHALFRKRASTDKLWALCQGDHKRAAYVQDLQLLYSTRYHDFLNTPTVDLCYFPCLNSFVSESPFCNTHAHIGAKSEAVWQADMQAYICAFEQASLLSNSPGEDRPLSYLKNCEHDPLLT